MPKIDTSPKIKLDEYLRNEERWKQRLAEVEARANQAEADVSRFRELNHSLIVTVAYHRRAARKVAIYARTMKRKFEQQRRAARRVAEYIRALQAAFRAEYDGNQ